MKQRFKNWLNEDREVTFVFANRIITVEYNRGAIVMGIIEGILIGVVIAVVASVLKGVIVGLFNSL